MLCPPRWRQATYRLAHREGSLNSTGGTFITGITSSRIRSAAPSEAARGEFPVPCGGFDLVATRGPVVAGYTYTCYLFSRFSRSVSGLTVLENAVRPANYRAHRPVGEPVGHHSTANQMSGLQATHRTSGAPAIRTEIDSAGSAAVLPYEDYRGLSQLVNYLKLSYINYVFLIPSLT